MGKLPSTATTQELLCWLAAHEGVSVEAHYTVRGLRCTHYLSAVCWQICDEGIDGELRTLAFPEFLLAYVNACWEIDAVDGESVPNCAEPMTTGIQPGELVSIYTLQLAMSGDANDSRENAQHCDEISETLRDWQYAADVALRDWQHIGKPVVVSASQAVPVIAEGAIFPTTEIVIPPEASDYTHPDQAMPRTQRAAPPLILWCKQCDAVSLATDAPCCDVHGYACPECGSDADSVRVYTVAEVQQLIAAGGSRLAARFAAVLAQMSTAEPPATAVPPDYVVIFLAGGVITDWQYLPAAEAQLAVVDWTDNDAEKRCGPWDHCLVYSATSDSGDSDAWAFPLDYARQEAAYAEVESGAVTPDIRPADFDVATVLALRPDWDAATAARFLTAKARDLAAGREAALTEWLSHELNQWETHR